MHASFLKKILISTSCLCRWVAGKVDQVVRAACSPMRYAVSPGPVQTLDIACLPTHLVRLLNSAMFLDIQRPACCLHNFICMHVGLGAASGPTLLQGANDITILTSVHAVRRQLIASAYHRCGLRRALVVHLHPVMMSLSTSTFYHAAVPCSVPTMCCRCCSSSSTWPAWST